MYQFLYYVYYGFAALLLIAVIWSMLRKTIEGDELRKPIMHEKMMAALVFVPLILRLLGVK